MTTIQDHNQPVYHVQMLGGFRFSAGDVVVDDKTSRTHQPWNLLEYLITHRHRVVTVDELIEALWPNDSSENPGHALKNLVYRVRTILASHGIPGAKELVLFQQGSYRFNNNCCISVDAETFSALCEEAKSDEITDDERIEKLTAAISLYRGDFLPGSAYEQWVIPLARQYRTLYFQSVYAVCEMLVEREDYAAIAAITEHAVQIDPYEERAHKYLIYALFREGKQVRALDHYSHATDLFYRELGVSPSESMRNLYREIAKSVNAVETDLAVIKEDLSEHGSGDGAFYCDYEVFKNMYRLEARSSSRGDQAVFIALFTVTDGNNNVPEPKKLAKLMDKLLDCIRSSLRKGDAVSRFSSTQYVLMLPTLTIENGRQVIDRIARRFRSDHFAKSAKLHTTIQSLDPLL